MSLAVRDIIVSPKEEHQSTSAEQPSQLRSQCFHTPEISVDLRELWVKCLITTDLDCLENDSNLKHVYFRLNKPVPC
jgi:hypothetical protein